MSFSLKDQLFNADRIGFLANQFARGVPNFDQAGFEREANDGLKDLELKQRISHIASVLENYLDPSFDAAAKQITDALPPPLDPSLSDDDFGDFIIAPLGEFVVRQGLQRKHLKRSLRLLGELTKRFSMEFAIRPFINEYPDETFDTLSSWSTDPNYHVRRLVSESTRPLLPWAPRIDTDPMRTLPLLDALHADRTRFVTRSVANHLNDIAKTDPRTVIATLKRWKQLAKQDAKELQWMTRHALRTLVKKGDKDAVQLLGYRANPEVAITDFQASPNVVRPGEAIEFSFAVSAARDEPLLIDYVIHFVKANGKTSPKVHKIKAIQIKNGETVVLKKRHPFRANATTFTLYPGTHTITLQINGNPFGSIDFEMKT